MLNASLKQQWPTVTFLAVLAVFFAAFLIYPLLYVFKNAFFFNGAFSLEFFRLLVANPVMRRCLGNSLLLGIATTGMTTLIGLPLAWLLTRTDFRGRALWGGLVLVPMIMPPFVGAIGMKYFFGRFGTINLLLLKSGLLDVPVDWLGEGRFWGVVIMETLHLFPIMYLNIAAAMANVDPAMEEAAANLGAGRWRLFRTVTFPLMLPGYFAGAIIVFIWAFTDLGTPLIFEFRNVVPVQIFNMVTDIRQNPMGYALVVTVILLTLVLFAASRRFVSGRRYEMTGRGGHVASRTRHLSPRTTVLAYLFLCGLIFVALLPHLAVVITSFCGKWFMTLVPETFTTAHYGGVFTHPMTARSIRTSLLLSTGSTAVDVVLGIAIAWILTRKKLPGTAVLDTLAMLPLALPGLVLAFGYVAGFSGTFLNPRVNPVPLLVIGYAVRRLPYMIRSVYAGLQQTSVTLEEASLNLGASPFMTLRRITVPLITANIAAGGILAFSFAMLEVSDSLILAMQEKFYPVTKAIYVLFNRVADGPYIASAMGVLGMVLLAASLVLTGKILGKKMGELFRTGG